MHKIQLFVFRWFYQLLYFRAACNKASERSMTLGVPQNFMADDGSNTLRLQVYHVLTICHCLFILMKIHDVFENSYLDKEESVEARLCSLKATDLHEAMMVLGQMPAVDPKLDIVELCGGEGLTTYLSHRRKLKTGANFELITGVDLTQRDAQEMVLKYLHFTKPRGRCNGTDMQSVRTSGWQKQDVMLHPETWEKSYLYASKLAAFCGQIALNQLEEGRHFLCEQPFPSRLYEVAPWPQVRRIV